MVKHLIHIILTLLFALNLCGQSDSISQIILERLLPIDSLESLLDSYEDKSKIPKETIYEFTSLCIRRDIPRMIKHIPWLESLKPLKDSFYFQKIQYAKSHIAKNQKDFDRAIELQEEYINYFLRQDPPQYPVDAYFYIASNYNAQKNINQATYYLIRGKEYAGRKHVNWLPRMSGFLGQIYRLNDYHDKALQEYHIVLNLPDLDNTLKLRTYIRLSDTFFEIDQIDSAAHYSNLLIDGAKKSKQPPFVNRGKLNLAKTYMLRGACDKAIKLSEPLQAFYTDKNPNRHGTYVLREILGSCFLEKGNYKEAEKILLSAYNLADSMREYSYAKTALTKLVECNHKMGKHDSAYKYYNILSGIQDTIYQKTLEEKLLDLNAEYLVEKKEEEISLLNSQNKVSQLQFKNARKNLFIAILAALGLLAIAILAFRQFSIKRKSETLLSEKNAIISSALSEKELLLKEIHHRVKNNLQVVSSLLGLQSEYIKDDKALTAINEGRNRVRSMALIHQNLYSEDNLTGVNVRTYLETLIKGLFDTYNINEEKIRLKLNIQDIDLDVDTVVPLGLIANELVSNALKHAFTDQDEGLVSVTLSEQNKILEFIVNDNGKGMDTSILNEDMESFGYQMISAFKDKLGAELNIDGSNGTKIEMQIKDYQKH